MVDETDIEDDNDDDRNKHMDDTDMGEDKSEHGNVRDTLDSSNGGETTVVEVPFHTDDVHATIVDELEDAGANLGPLMAQELQPAFEQSLYRLRQDVKYESNERGR